ncbi:hypothetical protein EVAR_100480_1 [Eumeta japonica]|uniref:Uncharacterized protein n=1 Tax=Eumeta variegata TaxID=151549 RepID=A0A4C2A4P6_EUMVA|nr:hypothetical protein EVAR_100480_1 [Eumeta japonica]
MTADRRPADSEAISYACPDRETSAILTVAGRPVRTISAGWSFKIPVETLFTSRLRSRGKRQCDPRKCNWDRNWISDRGTVTDGGRVNHESGVMKGIITHWTKYNSISHHFTFIFC